MIHQRKILKAIAYAILLCFTSLTGAQPLYAVPLNHQTPTGFESVTGNSVYDGHENISQTGMTAVNSWGDFSIGADATVNFTGPNGFNSFNYVKDGPVSEIYGQLNAIGGNIFIANPAGVQIGGSAQINVGSLYATTKGFDENDFTKIAGMTDGRAIGDYLSINGTITNPAAELMSLGSITSATSVTFDGSRIVLDTDRLFTSESGGGVGETQMDINAINKNVVIKTDDADKVVLGYSAYYDNGTPAAEGEFKPIDTKFTNIFENGTKVSGGIGRYMWVEDVFQLQAMRKYTNGWFALRNAIDANYSSEMDFASIGSAGSPFKGRFDGLDYHIFGLTIGSENNRKDNVGLFGQVGDGAIIRNVTLNGGSITGGENVGSIAGSVTGSALIENITNTADIDGTNNVGGIIGSLKADSDKKPQAQHFVNSGSVNGKTNVGGIVGEASGITLDGRIYNLGAVLGTDNNVGGIVGHALNTTIGNPLGEDAYTIYNQLGVTGGWNVGGIVGLIEGNSTVQNVANHGDVKATKFDTEQYNYHGTKNDTEWYDTNSEKVNIANAGGIVGKANGATIRDVRNDGDVTTKQEGTDKHYIAGNVGGIVGRAENTNITNADNSENHVAGAHNVGGVVGYLTGTSVVDSAQNDGGDIMATGARTGDATTGNFVTETIRQWSNQSEEVNIGNIGGIVGYLYGRNAQIKNSANRGTVHSAKIDDDGTVPDTAKAANVGGVVGKVSMGKQPPKDPDKQTDEYSTNELLEKFRDGDNTLATIYNSYNTGDVQGYMGVGGVAGQMIKGSVTASYNLGDVRSTRVAQTGTVDPLNMGGVVGDTLAINDGSGTVIYDVYNAGTIGDDEFNYLGRHVGGVVGRLGGTLEKAYNTGEIYNGYSVTGGVVGWWVSGNITNVFNTGNVTVVNKDIHNRNSLVGGIVGAANADTLKQDDNNKDKYSAILKTLSYAYNLGTIRSFVPSDYSATDDTTVPENQRNNINVVGGIIGGISEHTERYDNNNQPIQGTNNLKTIKINNVYTTGDLYAATQQQNGSYVKDKVNAIVGRAYNNHTNNLEDVTNAYYIEPEKSGLFSELRETTGDNDRSNPHYNYNFTKIDWGDSTEKDSYKDKNGNSFTFYEIGAAGNNYSSDWRFVNGSMPILNAFTPNTAKNDAWREGHGDEIDSVQYGTAANPLLTIINLKDGVSDIELDWGALGLSGAGSLAVYGGGLTLKNFGSQLGRYYNGTIFSEGVLNVNANAQSTGDVSYSYNLGSGSRLYGTSVNFNAFGNDATLYGTITSTNGDIEINGDNLNVIGSLKSSTAGESTHIDGIAKTPGSSAEITQATLNDLKNPFPTISDVYSYEANGSEEAKKDVVAGSISVDAKGSAEVLYGNMGEGKIDTQGDFTVSGKDSVYVDSDLHIGGDLNLNSDGEIVLDLSNMGNIGKDNLHNSFLDHFKNDGTEGKGTIKVGGVENAVNADNFMIAIDMWDYQNNEFALDKYDRGDDDTLAGDIDKLKINIGGNDKVTARDHTFIWVDGAEQLNGIQAYKDENADSQILSYNFALKGDVDASQLTNYNPIGSGTTTVTGDDGKVTEIENKFTGTFDGRGFRIIGLDVNQGGKDDNGNTVVKKHDDAGVFGTVGEGGTVKDLGIYSSHITGEDTAGAVAGRNEGTITGVTTFGNEVKVTGTHASTTIERGKGAGEEEAGSTVYVGAAGGITGVNSGTITNVHASDTVIASEGDAKEYDSDKTYMTVAGGVAGINKADSDTAMGMIGAWDTNVPAGVLSTSAVITDTSVETSTIMHGLGGIAGINESAIYNVAAFGATNGSYGAKGASTNEYVGGIMGVNYSPYVYGAYNESTVTGASNVGGIAGKNDIRKDFAGTIFSDGGQLNYVANAGSVTSIADLITTDDSKKSSYVGGIIGSNYGVINRGRNTGTVTGVNYVGGIAGFNASGAEMTNISNAIAAEISGENYVGGIVGTNAGEITGDMNLVNEGKVKGNQYVGGVAGENQAGGVIENVNTSINLDVSGTGAKYFGGVTGTNSGTITNAHNTGDISASEAEYVGGITGVNAENAVLENAGNSGNVFGYSHVGGVAAVNKSSHDGGKITNSGTVTAKNGGAAGIFYENEAGLNNVELVNTGSVSGKSDDHGTGGVIGVNNGNITNSKLTNSGNVDGGDNTGGLIGVNSGTISGSTLANTGYVKAGSGENVGGLIGKNTGSVIGGRNEADTMYVHKIYNNGGVSAQQGTNVGGLIGNNEGKLTAGYNTGNVRGQQNVGGIAGTNNGSISEVFNTVMTGDAEATGSISGVDNVGGLVGHNEENGTLTDAYNTTAVNGSDIKGNAVGTNEGAVKNVYAWNTNGKLIGSASSSSTKENTYSFVSGDGSANFVIPALGRMESGSYEGFDFGSTWKNYDGWSLPMLKVFLTKGEVSQNGVTAADGLAAFNNANSLIVFVPDPETGGMYMTVFSAQIAGSFGPDGVFNPNNLGYDLEGVYVRGNNNGFLHSDGWDRIKNFRERKAELYFHNGGMEYAEDM